MTIEHPVESQLPALRQLWKDTFSDTDLFLDAFFSTAFRPNRCLCAAEGGKILGSVYWFDCFCCGEKIAYIYALAVDRAYRGLGIGSRLMETTHAVLETGGYRGALLVPQQEGLIRMYERMGYLLSTGMEEFTCRWGDAGVNLRSIDAQAYARLRRAYLPEGGVIQEGENLAFLEAQAAFYAGDDFLLAARRETDRLFGLEILGNAQAAPGILRTLSCDCGTFRTYGSRPFAMYRPLKTAAGCTPAYFAFAFD